LKVFKYLPKVKYLLEVFKYFTTLDMPWPMPTAVQEWGKDRDKGRKCEVG